MRMIGTLLVAGSLVFLGLFVFHSPLLPGVSSGIVASVLFILGLVFLLFLPRPKERKPYVRVTGDSEAEITLHNEDPDDR
jgi:hypothetical protein